MLPKNERQLKILLTTIVVVGMILLIGIIIGIIPAVVLTMKNEPQGMDQAQGDTTIRSCGLNGMKLGLELL